MIDPKDLPDESELRPFEFANRQTKEWFEAKLYVSKLEEFMTEFVRSNGHPEIKTTLDLAISMKEGRALMLPASKHKEFQALVDQYLEARKRLAVLQDVLEDFHEPSEETKD